MLAQNAFESIRHRKFGCGLVGGSEKAPQTVLSFIWGTRCVLAQSAALQHALGASVLSVVRHESCENILAVAQIVLLVRYFHHSNFAAKMRNSREKTSGMDAKKLCVGSNWLIYSRKKFNV